MQSLQTETIDEFTIITGFQNRPINPIETRKQCAKAIVETDEVGTLRTKQEEQSRYITKLGETRKKAAYHLGLSESGIHVGRNKLASENQDKIAQGFVGTLNEINEELKPLALACTAKSKDILRNGPVFFEPRNGEIIKTEPEIEILKTKFAEKGEVQQVLENGDFIDDFRGQVFHRKVSGKWTEWVIETLGTDKPTGSKSQDELTESEKTEIEEQKESERVDQLSAEEKTSEYNSKKSEIAVKSQSLENELKFDGDVDYQSKAQTFYNTELDKLKTKYGVVQ